MPDSHYIIIASDDASCTIFKLYRLIPYTEFYLDIVEITNEELLILKLRHNIWYSPKINAYNYYTGDSDEIANSIINLRKLTE